MRARATIFRMVGVVLAGLLLALAGCGGAAPSAPVGQQSTARPTNTPAPTPTATVPTGPPYQVVTQINLAYGPQPNAGEVLDLCTPVGVAGPRPGVMLIHGGTWSSGDKTLYTQVCSLLASQGFVAATINYRLAPTYHWPAQLVDAQLAARWLRAHAGQYSLDPARLCALGDSAGAHLAVFLGVLTTILPGDQAGLLAEQPVRAACVVDAFGPVDLTTIATAQARQELFLQLFGATALHDHPTIARDASPLFAVTSQTSPTLIIQGTQDDLVPPSQSQALQQALQRAGVPVQYISYDGGHEFSGLTDAQRNAIILQAEAFLVAQEHP